MPRLSEVRTTIHDKLDVGHGAEINFVVDSFSKLPRKKRIEIGQGLLSSHESKRKLEWEIGANAAVDAAVELTRPFLRATQEQLCNFMNKQFETPGTFKGYVRGLAQGPAGVNIIIDYCSKYLVKEEDGDFRIEVIDLELR